MASSKKVDAIFRALSNERRRKILELVRKNPRSAWEIAKEFDCTWPAISRHLRVLKAAGLVRIISDLEETDRPVFVMQDAAVEAAAKWLGEIGPD